MNGSMVPPGGRFASHCANIGSRLAVNERDYHNTGSLRYGGVDSGRSIKPRDTKLGADVMRGPALSLKHLGPPTTGTAGAGAGRPQAPPHNALAKVPGRLRGVARNGNSLRAGWVEPAQSLHADSQLV